MPVVQVGQVSCVKHEIKLKPDTRIVRQRPYRLSPEKQEALDVQIQELLCAKVGWNQIVRGRVLWS